MILDTGKEQENGFMEGVHIPLGAHSRKISLREKGKGLFDGGDIDG